MNERIAFGSDASIDGFALRTVAMWIQNDASDASFRQLFEKGATSSTFPGLILDPSVGDLIWREDFSTAGGEWQSASSVGTGLTHVAVVYDAGSTANVPVIYVDGVSQTVATNTAPVGTQASDATATLEIGEASNGDNDYDGRIAAWCYDNTLWDAAKVNRHRWWGCAPGGPSTVKVWHPFWTSDLNNRGTATANGTATGTRMASLPRVERCWAGLMGCGR